jgi:hypothetical protein
MADLRFAVPARELAGLDGCDCAAGFVADLKATKTNTAHPTSSTRNIRSSDMKLLPWRVHKEKLIIVHTVAVTGVECGLLILTRNLQTLEFFSRRECAHCTKMRETI